MPLDLQAVFDEGYEKAAFAKRIDYQVSRADADWIEDVLVAKGLRTKEPVREQI